MKILSTQELPNMTQLLLSNGNGGIIGMVIITDPDMIGKVRAENWKSLEVK